MTAFAMNLGLAIAWSLLQGAITTVNLTIGFLFGYLFLAWLAPNEPTKRYVRRLPQALWFALFYFREVVLSTLRVALDVVTPADYRRPGIIAMPLDAKTDAEIALLSNLITFTPGTLSIDVSHDRKFLYVHCMFLGDPERDKAALKEGLERRVLELLR
jgi:multicomponent Na+:H+ antiporter subunit E